MADHAVAGGVRYLLSSQDDEGFWRDYDLRAGSSDAWTTAWVGWCLAGLDRHREVQPAVRRAVGSMLAASTAEGWGYNRTTGADADSTAWALNFLAACGFRCCVLAPRLLSKFISPAGAVRTFLDPLTGAWSDPHPDVAAVTGLALLASGAPRDLIARVRTALLAAAHADGTWSSFWWSTPVYATVWAGLLLRRTEGLTPEHATQLRLFLEEGAGGDTALERGLALLLAVELGQSHTLCGRLVADLLDGQESHLGWRPSPLLLIPPRHGSDEASGEGHPDVRGLVSTAVACLALSRWSQFPRGL